MNSGLILLFTASLLPAAAQVAPADWPNYARDLAGTKYSPLDQITPASRRISAQELAEVSRVSRMGTVVAVQRQNLYMYSPEGPLTVTLGKGVDVWKKTKRLDLADIEAGDTILVSGIIDSTGKLIADTVWANFNSFFGLIVSVNGNQYQVVLHRPELSGERLTVILDENVVNAFGKPLPPTDIQVGRFVQTIGMNRSDGNIEATKVVVYGDDATPLGGGPNPVVYDVHGRPSQK
jgi:hypothetical protein